MKRLLAVILTLVAFSTANAGTISYTLKATDLSGAPISSVAPTEAFLVHMLVEDLAAPAEGVFAAYASMEFDKSVAWPTSQPMYDGVYENGLSGHIIPADGKIVDLGAFAGLSSPGAGQQMVSSVQFTATNLGTASFSLMPAVVLPLHDTLRYGALTPVAMDEIDYGTLSLSVVPEPSNVWLVACISLAFPLVRRARK